MTDEHNDMKDTDKINTNMDKKKVEQKSGGVTVLITQNTKTSSWRI